MKPYIDITRPVNLLIGFLSIFMGGFVTGTVHPLARLILACISGTLIMAGANVINDVFDLEIDRINKPGRPLPSGRITVRSARLFAWSLFLTGCLTGTLIHWPGFSIACVSVFWLYMYSRSLKRTVLWGNFSVAFISGLAFVYGGLAVGRWVQAMIVGIFAFFYHFAREIIKDMEDIQGDMSDDAVTLPIRYGIRTAQVWATLLILLLVGLTFVPYALGIFSRIYLIIVILGVDAVLLFVTVSLWARPAPANWGRLSVIMKTDMLVGLIAVYFGG